MVIFSICGSLRNNSSNKTFLNLMRPMAPAGTEFIIYDRLSDLPHFNPDLDKEELLPPSVKELRGMINRSQAIIISTPEYAHGVPGSLKNMLDWLVSTTVLENKAAGIIFGSAGDARHAKDSLIEVLETMNAKVIPELVKSISGTQSKIDDPRIWQDLKDFVEHLHLYAQPKS